MRIEMALPLRFRGRRKRHHHANPIVVNHCLTADVREVSKAETSVAFRTEIARSSGAARECRVHDGRLFRRIAESKRQAERDGLFSFAFSRGSRHAHRADISGRDDEGPGGRKLPAAPLSDAILCHFEWAENRDNLSNNRSDFWPSLMDFTGPGSLARLYDDSVPLPTFAHHMRRCDFEAVRHLLVEYDSSGWPESEELWQAQIDKLLVIDGEIWMETPPPVYSVAMGPVLRNRAPRISICHYPDREDTRLVAQYFAIGDRDAAEAYAEDLLERLGAQWSGLGARPVLAVDRRLVDFDAVDPSACAFDQHRESLRRLTHALAIELRHALERLPKVSARLKAKPEFLKAVLCAYEATGRTNHVFGRLEDTSSWFDDLAEAWVRLGRPQRHYEFERTPVSNLLLSRGREAMNSRPIDLGPMLGPSP